MLRLSSGVSLQSGWTAVNKTVLLVRGRAILEADTSLHVGGGGLAYHRNEDKTDYIVLKAEAKAACLR